MTHPSFDYYSSSINPIDCAKWIAFIRLYAYVRTPACIYSRLLSPSSKQVWRNVHAIPVPDFISNILVECFEEVSAREASLELDNSTDILGTSGKDLYIESGVLPFRDFNSTFKPRDTSPYGLSRSAVVRLGATLISRCSRAVGCAEEVMTKMVVKCVEQLGRQDLEPAPLWPDEMDWLSRNDGTWTWGVMYDVEGC